MPRNIDLQAVANAIHGARADKFTGLHEELKAKMAELGVRGKMRTAKAPTESTKDVNVRGIVDWVRSLTPPVDTCAIDKAEAEAAGKKYRENKVAAARYAKECERFDEQKKLLQSLAATVATKVG